MSEEPGRGGGGRQAAGRHGTVDRLQILLYLRVVPKPAAQAAVYEGPHPFDGLALPLARDSTSARHHLAIASDRGPKSLDAGARRGNGVVARAPPTSTVPQTTRGAHGQHGSAPARQGTAEHRQGAGKLL